MIPKSSHPAEDGVRVETAAVRIGEAVFTLPRPNRHHNVIWWLSVLGVPSGQMHDQGFVLSDGTYASRGAAKIIALRAQQCIADHSPNQLFSEDLWDGGADLPSAEDIKRLQQPLAAESSGARWKAALERLGSMEAFEVSRTIDPTRDAELLARIDFARTALSHQPGEG